MITWRKMCVLARSSFGVGIFALFANSCGQDVTGSPPGMEPAAIAAVSNTSSGDGADRARVQAFLDRRYTSNDVKHSFHTKFNETIDCIDFFAQPGVKQLAAQGRPITALPAVDSAPQSSHPPKDLPDVAFNGQPDDQGNPRACPPDTVPVVRVTADEIINGGGLDGHLDAVSNFKRGASAVGAPKKSGSVAFPTESGGTAYAYAQSNFCCTAQLILGQGNISIFNSYVQGGPTAATGLYDHSIGQTWMVSSDQDQTIEVGYIVSPGINSGDKTNAHLFVFSTTDAYASGCYNNNPGITGTFCDGPFIQSPGALYAPGMILSASAFGGSYQAIDFYTYFGSAGGANAWIINNVGYYPATNFWGSMATGTARDDTVGFEVDDHSGAWTVPMASGSASNASFNFSGTRLHQRHGN